MPDTLTAHERTLLSALELANRWLKDHAPFSAKQQIAKALAESYRMQDMGRTRPHHYEGDHFYSSYCLNCGEPRTSRSTPQCPEVAPLSHPPAAVEKTP